VRTPSATVLLDAWEAGAPLAPEEQALRLLQLGWPEASREELAALPLGERDARLARLRAGLFGPRLDARVDCPKCGEALELDLDGALLYGGEAGNCRGELTVAGRRLRFRVPDSGDLLAVSAVADPATARDILLQRCVEVPAPADGDAAAAAQLPETVKEALELAMEEADPHANLSLAMACPACRHNWQAVLDIPGFFRLELEEWAWRLLREVQALARAYGWSERDILAMSPWRRRAYLELAES